MQTKIFSAFRNEETRNFERLSRMLPSLVLVKLVAGNKACVFENIKLVKMLDKN